MEIAREEFLGKLQQLTPGLSAKSAFSWANYVVFSDGRMFADNGYITAFMPTELDFGHVAVPMPELMAILGKLKTDLLDVEKEKGQIVIKSGRSKAGIVFTEHSESLCSDVFAEYDALDFQELPESFMDALNRAKFCAASDSNRDALHCLHYKDGKVEAIDGHIAIRIAIDGGDLPELLIPVGMFSFISGLKFTGLGVSESRAFFTNKHTGLVVAVPLYRREDSFPDLEEIFDRGKDGMPFVLPKELLAAIDKALIFRKSLQNKESFYVVVSVKSNRVILRGEGDMGWYEESFPVASYDGSDLRMCCRPENLNAILPLVQNASLKDEMVMFKGDDFTYVFMLMRDKEVSNYSEDEQESAESESEDAF